MERKLFLLMLLVGAACPAADLGQQIRALRPADSAQLRAAVFDRIDNRAARAAASIPRARDAAEADRMRPHLRRSLEEVLGFRRLPWPPKLQARVSGVLHRDGYRIEKVVYETLPGVVVAAHLYVPDALTAPAPGIIFYPGHWREDSKTRPEFQAFCINMARLGFVVMNFDPIGQGERGVSTRDHRRAEGLLVGISHQGFAEYDTQCALEYLLSRKEVDPERIGMTGASGGGYNTWFTAALDERIRVAVPVVGSSDFLEHLRSLRPLNWRGAADHCHMPARLIRVANNHELLAAIAPRPLLVIGASADRSFPINGVREVCAYGKRIYSSYGAADRLRYFEDTASGHDYARQKREAAYGWFLKWLMRRGNGSPYPEPATAPEQWDSAELRCLSTGSNAPAGPGTLRAVRAIAESIRIPDSPIDWEAILGDLPEAPRASLKIRDVSLQRLKIPVGDGIFAPAFLLKPIGSATGVVVALRDDGKEALATDPVIRRLYESGWAICGVDPRGIGELKSGHDDWAFAVSLLLGENVVWQQGWDVRRTLESLAAHRPYRSLPLGLYAQGHNASMAAMYALAQRSAAGSVRPRWFVLRDGFLSFRHFLDRPRNAALSFRLLPADPRGSGLMDREIPGMYFVFNGLRYFDLPRLLKGAADSGLLVNPINGDWERLAPDAAERLLPGGVRVLFDDAPDAKILRSLGLRE